MWRTVLIFGLLIVGVVLAEDGQTTYVDLNFDGHPDKLEGESRGGGRNARNVTYQVSLFDPQTKTYVFNDALSTLGSLEAHPDSKTLTSFWRSGPIDTSYVYQWEGFRLVLVQETVREFKDGGTSTTVKKLKNGKLEVASESFNPAR